MKLLDSARLKDITGKARKSAQVRWFRDHLGVEVPHDRRGPILTEEAYQKLLEKRLGLLPFENPEQSRPSVKLMRKKAA